MLCPFSVSLLLLRSATTPGAGAWCPRCGPLHPSHASDACCVCAPSVRARLAPWPTGSEGTRTPHLHGMILACTDPPAQGMHACSPPSPFPPLSCLVEPVHLAHVSRHVLLMRFDGAPSDLQQLGVAPQALHNVLAAVAVAAKAAKGRERGKGRDGMLLMRAEAGGDEGCTSGGNTMRAGRQAGRQARCRARISRT